MKSIAILLFVACAQAILIISDEEYQQEFIRFTVKFNKHYKNEDEMQYRFQTFKSNYNFIKNFNGTSHKVGVNKFADLSNEEFNNFYNGMNVHRVPGNTVSHPEALPVAWNWQTKGAVSHVKNQEQCGSCWSFSAAEAIEGCHFLSTGTLVWISEQNLVDCSTAQGNQGCNGGLMDDAFQYVIANGGIDTETCYPYTAEDGTCAYSAQKPCCGSTVTAYTDVTSGDEGALQTAVYGVPTSVAIDASQSSFQFYESGVYYEPACSSTNLDHGVLAVGWGHDATSGNDYWIVKNSWGADWGMSGYIWMARNMQNNCGIATAASFVTGCGNCK